MIKNYEGVSIVLGGAAGQGVQIVENILTNVLHRSGFTVSANKEYMSRIRGGSNSTEIRVTSQSRTGYVRSMDICFPLDSAALTHLMPRITPATVVLGDTQHLKTEHKIIDVPLARIAEELGNPLMANTVAASVILGLFHADETLLEAYLTEQFQRKGEDILQKNILASQEGYQFGHHLAYMESIHIPFPTPDQQETKKILLNGNQSLGRGFIAGGVNFLSSYPMSPGTGILTFYAEQAVKHNLVVEQAEDEISAINMGLGASYAGARSLVTTSGGGFALMTEGVSLAGMIETPIIIHIAMRPGPATGLPTRTEQADLNLALYSGHGEFPRAIYAPGDAVEAFAIGQEASRIADTYQSPVFVLTDQYFLDVIEVVDEKDLLVKPWLSTIVKTTPEYERYAVTKNGVPGDEVLRGVSPRGVPGYGTGLVAVDSDEHTPDGHITEDLDMRVTMMDKRLQKEQGIRSEVLPPTITGDIKKAKTILVGWGSTKSVIAEAVDRLESHASLDIAKKTKVSTGIASVHFAQVWPLPEDTQELFAKAKKVVVIENNATGQFAKLLKLEGVDVTENILKYNGEPFSVEELVEELKSL
ncbi:MAG: 2-oxoacid:acceptor oxidoreductase subunit alpha [Candidatus Moraniibacteriota bacterium]